MNYADTKKRRKTRDISAAANFGDDALREWPNLCSGLDSYLDAGRNRSLLAVHIYCKRGRIGLRVQDREDSLQFFAECETIEEIWPTVEYGIQSESTEWLPLKLGEKW